jgi:YbbR domain-containing protein
MRKNLLLKILVLILAALFWIIQSLWRYHYQQIELPLRFLNLSNDLIILNEQSPEIELEFEARGLDFIAFKLTEVFIEIDAENFQYGKNSFTVEPSNLKNPGKVKLNMEAFQFDHEYTIELDKIIEREIPIQIEYATAGDEEFFLKNKISDSPRSISVNGPKSIIDQLQHIKTEKINQKMLKDGKINVELILPDPRLRLIRNEIILEVIEAKQIDRIISLIPINYPLDLEITIIPQKISVMIMGPQEIIDKVERSSIIAFISRDKVKNLNPGESLFVTVDFTVPTGVKLVEYTPQQIQVIKND